MLVQLQEVRVAAIGFERRLHAVLHPRLWLHVVEQHAQDVDERLFGRLAMPRAFPNRRLIGFVLRGETQLFAAKSVDAAPGTIFAANGRTFGSRSSGQREPSLTVTIEWDASYFASPSRAGLSIGRCALSSLSEHVEVIRRGVERARACAVHERAAAEELLAADVARFCSWLRAEGYDAPAIRAEDLRGAIPPSVRALSHAMDLSLSMTDARPMMIDVNETIELTPRTVQRRLPEVLRLWGRTPEPFRSFRDRRRIFLAALLMSNPRATTELGARVIGFSSPTAFCRAFHTRGLPSPGRIREELARLA